MRLLVVPRRTSQTPVEAWVGEPDMFSHPSHVDISVVFTRDIPLAKTLQSMWETVCPTQIGGPAFDDSGGEFVPGKFVARGIVHTSRGCPKRCPFCYVPKREGNIRILPIHPGNVIQDNNLLACPQEHIEKVFEMLRHQHSIRFLGGIDKDFLRDWHIDRMRGLRVREIWLSDDTIESHSTAIDAIKKFQRAGFRKRQIRCYVLCGYGSTMADDEKRLTELVNAGCLPFAQLYDGIDDRDSWKKFIKLWSRPAAYLSGRGS